MTASLMGLMIVYLMVLDRFKVILSIEEFYMGSYRQHSLLHDSIMSWTLMMTYGNYAKIYDRYPSDMVNYQAIDDTISYWTKQSITLWNILDNEYGQELKRVLFDDVCEILEGTDFYEVNYNMCMTHPMIKKGYIAFLHAEKGLVY